MKRKQYTKEFKTKVGLEVIKGQKMVNELASEYGVHATPTQHLEAATAFGLTEGV